MTSTNFTRYELLLLHEAMLKMAHENMLNSEFGFSSEKRSMAYKEYMDCKDVTRKIEKILESQNLTYKGE